jgi:hypothetical protein
MSCEVGMSDTYHVHARIAIIRNGVQLAIPGSIGRPASGCLYGIHTHDSSGVIHLESPAYQRYTVGNMFDIWGQPLSLTNVAGIAGMPVAVYINDGGDVRQYMGNPADIAMISQRTVTFQIGSALPAIPAYTWSSR